jgi:hypothetical protein
MIRRFAAALCAAVLLGGLLPASATAQTGNPGSISIVVTDAASKAPISLARVILDGPVITTEFTDDHGIVQFIDVPDGIYEARVVKRGYDSVTSAQFEVVEGRAVSVAVALALSQSLKVIATVAVKSTATISTTSIDNNSAQRKLSSDLIGALGKLAGVSIDTSSTDSDATETISLSGQDASQTALTVDGIPLNAPGTAGNANLFSSDLFTGASVRYGASVNGLAGGVNFTTAEPTLTWQGNDSFAVGSNGANNWTLGESGSFGKFGVAVTLADRLRPSLLDGMTYLDSSGLTYNHDGDSTSGGEMVKLRYKLDDAQVLSAQFLGSTGNSDVVSTKVCGALPCGYGPGNFSTNEAQQYALTDNALLGDTVVQATVYGRSFSNTSNRLNRYIAGVLSPTGSTSAQRTRGFSIQAELPAKERHTLSISAQSSSTSFATTPLIPSAAQYYNGSQQTSYSSIQLIDRIRSSTKLALSEIFGFSQATNSPVSLIGTTGLNWAPTSVDSYSFSYSVGGSSGHGGRSTILSDPGSLSYNCAGDIVSGRAPGDQPGRSSSTSANFSYTHKWSNAQFSASLDRQVQNGIVMGTDVNATALAGILPPGYLGDVQNIYDSQGGCGYPAGTPFYLNQLYFETPVGGMRAIYEGARLSGYVTLGDLVIEPNYSIIVAERLSNDPRIDNPYSTIISGSQIPGRPLHSGGLVLDYKPKNSAFEYVADAQYTGTNNRNNLPAYTTFDAGVVASLSRGELIFNAQNITNRFAGIFSSPDYAVPLQTAGGTLIPQLARPLTPRSYSVTYQIRFGQGIKPSNAGLASAAGGRGGRRGGFRGRPGGPGGQGGFRNAFLPIGATPPPNPLDVNASDRCTTAGATAAHALLDPLKAFVAKIEAAKTATGYPATMPAPVVPGWGVIYHGLGDTYALTISPKKVDPSLMPCMFVHFARDTDVAAHHLYQPTNSVLFVPQITFMPSVGLYVAPRAQTAGQEQFRVYKLPTKAPKAPFAPALSPECTADMKATATELLNELKAHFAAGAPTPNWTVTPHQAKAGTYYELGLTNISELAPLLSCGHISTANNADLAKAGWAGARPPALNYAAPYGLYFVRGGPRPSPSPAESPSPSPAPSS